MRYNSQRVHRHPLIVAVLVLSGIPALARAQYPPPAQPQVRAQIAQYGSRWMTGRFDQTGDSLRFVTTDGMRVPLSETDISHVQINKRSSHAGIGALAGGVAGVAIGLSLAHADPWGGWNSNPTTGGQVLLAALFGAAGAGVGAVVGGSIGTDNWVDAPRPWVEVGTADGARTVEIGLVVPTGETP
jgi:hypothetical protein